jgi:hypothetical protein
VRQQCAGPGHDAWFGCGVAGASVAELPATGSRKAGPNAATHRTHELGSEWALYSLVQLAHSVLQAHQSLVFLVIIIFFLFCEIKLAKW